MAELDEQIAIASKLPPLDAAYSLVRYARSGWRPNADLGPAFDWLKRAHPDTDDSALQNAIRTAVKFDQDCNRFFAYNSKNYIEDVTEAVNRASSENPGFTQPTLQSAHSLLSWAMR